jgi:hypothetical protein
MAVHLGVDGENLIKQVATYIDETLQAEGEPIRPEKVLCVVSSKLQELEEDAEKEQQNDNTGDGGLAGATGGVPQPAAGDGNGAMEPQQEGGGSSADASAPPSELRSSARLHGGLKTALECYKRRLDIAVDQANHVNLEDLETCLEASEKLTITYVDLQAQCAGKAAAEGGGNAWQQEFAVWTVGIRPVKERLAAAIRQLQEKQRVNMYRAASRAVDRALAAADDALGDNDPHEIEEVRQQLSAKVREMEAAAAYLDDDPLLQDGQKLQAAEKSLRKLGKKKTELLQTNVGSSLTFKVPPWRRRPVVSVAPPPVGQVPPPVTAAVPSTVQTDSALTGDAVASLLSILAKGQSKLATPNWPRFNDSYRSYYLFKEEVMAYIRDYGHGVGDRSLAEQIKNHCVSKGIAEYLVFADLPQEILNVLGGLFAKPSKLIED